jgi:hypothetical protein
MRSTFVDPAARGDTVGALTIALEGAPYGPGVDEAKARCTIWPTCAHSLKSITELDIAVCRIDPEQY